MPTAGSPAARLSESALGTLPLLGYLALAAILMVSDHRGGIGSALRQRASVLAEPVWWLASAPQRWSAVLGEYWRDHADLRDDNLRLRRELEVSTARLQRLAAVSEENQRLRELLGGTRGYRLSAQLAGIVGVDLDPWRQRLLLDVGSDDGIEVGQALLDSGGVLGQVIEVMARQSTALLVTDPEHAVPVQVVRSGLRAIAYGSGQRDRLVLPNIPQSADIRAGDRLVTSGIGGRFPAGFPVGTVQTLRPDDTRLFLVAEALPAARLDRGSEVLLVKNSPDEVGYGPPLPESDSADSAAEVQP
ncbi:MAG TPA: rod shape-determining protein MreC [Arenimonas sp.]|nr:rod shape-determining protein MreC [Arenimonas sp.]